MSSLSVPKQLLQNNKLQIFGRVLNDPVFYRETYGEKMFTFNLEVPRKSGSCDILPVMMSAKYVPFAKKGSAVVIDGQIRSYSRFATGKRQVCIYAFCRSIVPLSRPLSEIENCNIVQLRGVISRQPVLRKTPRGREICDFHMLIERSTDKVDYIPAIAWAHNARVLDGAEPKVALQIEGRLQSRDYTKKTEGTPVDETAYEVSIASMSFI